MDPVGSIASTAVRTISVLPGIAVAGSNRINIAFADNAIRNTWLRVTVLANAKTGLATALICLLLGRIEHLLLDRDRWSFKVTR